MRLGYLNAMAGRFTEARELSARSRAILEDLGLTLMLPTLDGWAGQVELLAGDPAAAERLWRRAYQALEGLGEKGNLSTIAAYLAEAVYQQGRLRRGRGADAGLGEHDVPRRRDVADLLAHGTREGGCPDGRPRVARHSRLTRSPGLRRRTGRISAAALWRRWPRCSWPEGQNGHGGSDSRRGARLYEAKGSVAAANGYAPASIPSRRAISPSASPPRRRHDEGHPRPEARACELAERRRSTTGSMIG